MTNGAMQRDFTSRGELIDYVRSTFPHATAADAVSEMQGGRRAAEALLADIDPAAYRTTRNMLDGAVTHLSPYLRHGVVSLDEVRRAALAKADDPRTASKLISELGWRDYFQRVYRVLGDGVWNDQEPYKTGFAAEEYDDELPQELVHGTTGLACMDAFSRQLRMTGYLHNHARLWLAAYVVHFQRIRWQAGARWFLEHLLDGDPASNNLSWQWVASVFSHKPYFFNRENLETFTKGVYCRDCPLYGRCAFEGPYESLEAQLFPRGVGDPRSDAQRAATTAGNPLASVAPKAPVVEEKAAAPIIWLHGDNLSPHSPALTRYPEAPAVWVWDDALLEQEKISLKRLVFIYECLLELPVEIRRGNVAVEVQRFADEHVPANAAAAIVTNDSPDPRFHASRSQLERRQPVRVLEEPAFVNPAAALDLRRFSRYWRKVQRLAQQS